jgi:AcrR family transcriptional regulator
MLATLRWSFRGTVQAFAGKQFAKRAGLNRGTLHYYFPGKEALIHGVLDYIVKELFIGRGPANVVENDRGWKRLLMAIVREGIQKREF